MRTSTLLFLAGLAGCIQDATPTSDEVDAMVVTGPDARPPQPDAAPFEPDVRFLRDAAILRDARGPADAGPTDAELPPDTGAIDPCDLVLCEECWVCDAGECVPDEARVQEDAPVCGTMCMDWSSACLAVTSFHEPLRAGTCFDADEAARCEASGGSWAGGACGHHGCGVDAEDCWADCGFGCDCGPWSEWDADRGCVGRPGCGGGACDAEAVCAGAWRGGADGACVDLVGRPLDAGCCVANCPDVGFYRDPRDGACVQGARGCDLPPNAPPCDGGPPCDLGLFLVDTARVGARGGVCYGPGSARPQADVSVRPLVRNYGDEPVEITFTDRCPDGAVRLAGLAADFDYYDTCAAGICENTGMPRSVLVHASWSASPARIDPDGGDCNGPLAPGTYALTGDLPLTSAHTVCNFAALELRIVGAE